ncbi:hypothetical protein B0H66DRAFT_527448 [Apodospora peruviana]|uniref:Transcription initiation factor TFIID subunit 1 histone acetyltransferase domain-containing protein n=1 Tax=Apodospora peruviana TaxID=516989 RepID=A0AAE0MFR9_9PEZI|nr:hypothetical protein B0H66DRAFT_527448 [Apodospora peruviana]
MAPSREDVNYDQLNEKDWRDVEQEDNNLIRQALQSAGSGQGNDVLSELVGKIYSGAGIDQTEKADDAIDFEDLSDDDLPEEEEATGDNNADNADLPDLTDDAGTSGDLDDLFGEGPSSPVDIGPLEPDQVTEGQDHRVESEEDVAETLEDLRAIEFRRELERQTATEESYELEIPGEAESLHDAVKKAFPDYDQHAILYWNELLPQKRANYISKRVPKLPKPLIPTKLSLELDADEEKLFRLPAPACDSVYQKIKATEAERLFYLVKPERLDQADVEFFDLDSDGETKVGGFTLQDVITVCDDWESVIAIGDAVDSQPAPETSSAANGDPDDDAAWDEMFLDEPPAKRRRIAPPHGLPPIPQFRAPNFDNFEQATAKLGKRVLLDMNDPYLLIDDADSEQRLAKRRKVQHKTVRLSNGKMGKELSQRFNFSSDAAYDALKENNQNRVRATLATIPVEHSMTAQRLSWPFYRVKLAASDPHSYHRPTLNLKKDAFHPVKFAKPAILKRKTLKGKKISEIFKNSSDLSMNDNSTGILFEYCEEIPTVLSNFGMGQKIVNYYRRTKGSDVRPEKRELGENCVLMPEDRSPFAIFGQVNPGEVVPTLHNYMFRAPIFKHTPKDTDFILGRSSTGKTGSTWYIRPIDHLYVVGQTMPSMEVPGPHSRRVTNIAKNRLKMVSFRLLRRNPHVTLHDITQHVAESNESQNRQKLKEFLNFRKETKDWALREGEEELDEAGIRALVKPEEVCLLDAMQVGAHELENGGYELNGDSMKDDDAAVDQPDELPPDALASKMAPWRLTKAFIDASHGKAMLAVHGAGDPTGKGLGISFLRTSMKGGYLEQLHGPLSTSADAIERVRKANGGHLYNVKNQDTLYTEAINKVWTRQRESLQDTQEYSDEDIEMGEDEDVERFGDNPGTQTQTPGVPDGMSQVSQSAAGGGANPRKLKITREVRVNGEVQTVTEIVHDPVVISQYLKRRRTHDVEKIDIYQLNKLTGDKEKDQLILELARKEQERLERNRERTQKREKQKQMQQKIKGPGHLGEDCSPEPSVEKASGTSRKCANCGLVGHIKTNKRLCPKLNGSLPRDPTQDETPGLGSINAPVAASFVSLS